MRVLSRNGGNNVSDIDCDDKSKHSDGCNDARSILTLPYLVSFQPITSNTGVKGKSAVRQVSGASVRITYN